MNRGDEFREYFQRYAAVSLGSEPEKLAEFYDQSFLVSGPTGGAAFRNDAAFLDWLRQVHAFNAEAGRLGVAANRHDQGGGRRRIRYEVDTGGDVVHLRAGGSSIKYVERCV